MVLRVQCPICGEWRDEPIDDEPNPCPCMIQAESRAEDESFSRRLEDGFRMLQSGYDAEPL